MHLRGEENLKYKPNIKTKVKVVFSAFNDVENFKMDHVIVVLALVSIIIGPDPRQCQGIAIKLCALLATREA